MKRPFTVTFKFPVEGSKTQYESDKHIVSKLQMWPYLTGARKYLWQISTVNTRYRPTVSRRHKTTKHIECWSVFLFISPGFHIAVRLVVSSTFGRFGTSLWLRDGRGRGWQRSFALDRPIWVVGEKGKPSETAKQMFITWWLKAILSWISNEVVFVILSCNELNLLRFLP